MEERNRADCLCVVIIIQRRTFLIIKKKKQTLISFLPPAQKKMKREEDEQTLTLSPAAPPATRTGMPIREDCWSEEASCTLVEAWGERYLELNRGNLRQKHWQLVADTVNNRHANDSNNNKKSMKRTDVQCKNRIDTLKKKYKLEKARDGTCKSDWPLYHLLDVLIGDSVQSKKMMIQPTPQPQLVLPYYKHWKVPGQQQQPSGSLTRAMFVPVTLRGDKQKRSATPAGYAPAIPTAIDESFCRRNYSAAAAAAAADVGVNSDSSRSSAESNRCVVDGFGELAKAISRFADIYERVEGAKQRQMMELEKERMEFMKSLEYQRMQYFMDSQAQIEKIKRAKRNAGAASD